MPRDANKSEAYFSQRIDFGNSVIHEDMRAVESFPRLEGRAGMASSLVRHCFKNLVCRYSRGDNLESMRPAAMQWLQAKEIEARVLQGLPPELKNIRSMYEKLTLDRVYEALTMLAFARALDFAKQDMARLIAAMGHSGEDALIDETAKALGDIQRPVAAECKYPKVYAPLLEVWRVAPEQRPAQLLAYAQQWKRKIKPMYWSDSLNGAEGAYFGYWCFDVALAAMVLDIPDQALRANPYYPGDLVDTARDEKAPFGSRA